MLCLGQVLPQLMKRAFRITVILRPDGVIVRITPYSWNFLRNQLVVAFWAWAFLILIGSKIGGP